MFEMCVNRLKKYIVYCNGFLRVKVQNLKFMAILERILSIEKDFGFKWDIFYFFVFRNQDKDGQL